MASTTHKTDVLVVGGGNAGLCAALAAAEQGASVTLVEKGGPLDRGANSRHTRNLRCAHNAPDEVLRDRYTAQEFLDDILRVTGNRTNPELAQLVVEESLGVRDWMARWGARFQPALTGTLNLAHSNAFFLGGGKALMNSYYRAARRLGIQVLYGQRVNRLLLQERQCTGADVGAVDTHDVRRIEARAVVLACGGLQGNRSWLRSVWGEAADNLYLRGSANNSGELILQLLQAGARGVGDDDQCHAIAVDARGPAVDGGIVTRLDCVPYALVVNNHGERFYDEGEDMWPRRYAIWGRLIAQQPDQRAYAIFDGAARADFMASVFPPYQADSLVELAQLLEIPADRLEHTINDYQQAPRVGNFDPGCLDGCATQDLKPPKSNWARPLKGPPYFAYPLRCGITFTYRGLEVDDHARILFADGASENLFAAGECMAGNVLGQGYVAGLGMTIGAVFGRIAGREAAARAR